MKIPVIHEAYDYISDASFECDSRTAFVKTAQNASYESDAKEHNTPAILLPKDCHELLGINSKMQIVGITGTNGKTTTAAAIYSMLLDLRLKSALQGTRGCFINEDCIESHTLTTPPILKTLLHLAKASKAGCKYFIMEVSSHAIVQKRVESLGFALKVFTNLSQDHLDFHKSMESYRNVKSQFFADKTLKLINCDEKKISYNPTNSYTYGVEAQGDFSVKAYGLKDGIQAIFSLKGEECLVDSNLQGSFNVYNLLAAVASIKLLESPKKEDLEAAISGFGGVSGRMEVVSLEPQIIVDFAHTPDGMMQVLSSLKHRPLVVVFGAGGDRDTTKRTLMGKIAMRYAKRAIVTSDNPRNESPEKIIEDICYGMRDKPEIIVNRHEAIVHALSTLKKGETLIILGKGDENYQEINGTKHPFDDRQIVREWLASIKT